MDLYAHQITGSKWLTSGTRRGLADEAGLGKTVTSLVAAENLGADSVSVICPAVAVDVWRTHEKRFTKGFKSFEVYSYEKATTMGRERSRLARSTRDVLILDEAHYLKSPDAVRTRMIYGTAPGGRDGLVNTAGSVWPLTATPAPNHVGEYFTHLRALWPEHIPASQRGCMNLHQFLSRYSHFETTRYGFKVLGVKNAAEIRSVLRSCWLRRTVQDALPGLPDWSWNEVPLHSDDAQAYLTVESQNGTAGELEALLECDDMSFAEAQAAIESLSTLRRLIGRLKAPLVADLIKDELTTRAIDKVVIFGVHHDTLNALHGALASFNPVQITGETPTPERDRIATRFNTDPSCRVFLGQIKAAGVAITLTAANHVCFAETNWTPEDVYQAAKRVHRIGQHRPVFVRIFGLAGSIDDAVNRVLARKSRALKQVEI